MPAVNIRIVATQEVSRRSYEGHDHVVTEVLVDVDALSLPVGTDTIQRGRWAAEDAIEGTVTSVLLMDEPEADDPANFSRFRFNVFSIREY